MEPMQQFHATQDVYISVDGRRLVYGARHLWLFDGKEWHYLKEL